MIQPAGVVHLQGALRLHGASEQGDVHAGLRLRRHRTATRHRAVWSESIFNPTISYFVKVACLTAVSYAMTEAGDGLACHVLSLC